jgi:CheY-like chemotaxis protein
VSRHILLVDDEVGICQALQAFLESQGHEVTYATTANEALPAAIQADLVICDLNLGSDSGLAVIERLKQSRPELKILVLTGAPSITALQAAKDLGVSGFLTKPIGLPELLSNVSKVLGEELGPVLLFPSGLKEKVAGIVPFIAEMSVADPPNWLRVRTMIRAVGPSCVLADGSVPETIDFLDACSRELDGVALFILCREEDFNTARQLIARFPAARCVTIDGPPEELLRSISTQVIARRDESTRNRARLSKALSRCKYSEPLRLGYYCTISGPCPFEEEKDALVTVRGKDFYRCPKRPFLVPSVERVGLLTWSGTPDEPAILQYRAEAMEQIRLGRTHVVVNCQTLEATNHNLIEILGDIENGLSDTPDARIDVINLAPRLLVSLRKSGEFLVNVKFHGRVLIELEHGRHSNLPPAEPAPRVFS